MQHAATPSATRATAGAGRHRGLPALALLLAAALAGCAAAPTAGPAATTATPKAGATTTAPDGATQALHALFDASWEANMQRYPEWASQTGDLRYGDRLFDASPEAEAALYADVRHHRAAARAIARQALGAQDRVSLDLFIHGLEDELAMQPLVGYRRMTLGATGGFHTDFAALVRASPVRTVAQVDQLLARMAAYPRRVDQEITNLRQGLALGWVAPQPVVQRVVAALDKQLADPGDANPFYRPFADLGSGIAAAERAALQARARVAIATQVLPAQQRLRDFVAGDYARAAPAAGNLSNYPGGAAVYAALVRQSTTTTLTADEVHATGLREVARLQGEIAQVMRSMNWTGDFASFAHHLNTDPKYFHPSGDALLAAHRDIAKRIDAELPSLFAELPRATYGVRAMPAYLGPDSAEYYESPPLDGSRAGWFNANATGYKTRPTWSQETLTAHEAVPGHHLQTARALELGELPKFRRSNWYVAYGEGWALYAETLGFELGLYKDPASHFGHLQAQIFRAARLVVDTGLHQRGWTRQQAIDYMVATTGYDRSFVESEVDRYTSWPSQALGYMVGQLQIMALRDRARAALGGRFDIRRFHMVVLDSGAVPMTVLARQVDDWIAAERVRH